MARDSVSKNRANFFSRHRWLTFLGIALIVLLVCITVLLPPAIRWGLEKWLESHGRLKAEVQDVDFNLFTGNLVIHSLVTQREGGAGLEAMRAAVELELFPVFKKRVLLNDVSLTDTTLDVTREENGNLYVGGLRVPSDEKRQKAVDERQIGWEIGFGGIDLNNVTIVYSEPGHSRELTIIKGHIDPLQSWNPAAAGDFSLEMSIGGGRATLEGSVRPYARKAGLKAALKVNSMALDWFNPWITAPNAEIEKGTLDGRVSISASAAENVKAALDGTLTLDDVVGTLGGNDIGPVTITWDGSLKIEPPEAGADSPRFHAQGKLVADRPNIQMRSPGIAASAGELTVEGELSSPAKKDAEPAAFVFNGKMSLANLEVGQADQNTPLAAVEQVFVTSLKITGLEQITAKSAQALGAKLYAGPGEKTRGLSLGELNVNGIGIEAGDKTVKLASVSLLNVEGEVTRGREGDVRMVARWPDMTTAENEPKARVKTDKAAWHFVVDTASIGENSSFFFRDFSVSPAVDLHLTQIEGQLKNIDSRTSDRSPVNLAFGLGDNAHFKAEGGITPLTTEIDMDVTGDVKRFSLTEIRGYAKERLGYTIRSGQLYADFHFKVTNSLSDSRVKLFITDLDLERIDTGKLDEFTDQLGMSLDAALDLLRDGDRNIRLELPITGKVTRPNVEFGSVIAKAVKNASLTAIKTAALTYFAPLGAAYFAPLGAAYIAGKLIGKAMAVRLNAVDFEAGQAKLDASDREYLAQVVDKLNSRPKVHLLLCGQAVASDKAALASNPEKGEEDARDNGQGGPPADISEGELLDLAEKRAAAVRGYLVSKGIASQRFIPCAPEIVTQKDIPPQVELGVR